MALAYIVTRDVTPEECPWLDETVPNGTRVWMAKEQLGTTPEGMAVSRNMYQGPTFEVPKDALEFDLHGSD